MSDYTVTDLRTAHRAGMAGMAEIIAQMAERAAEGMETPDDHATLQAFANVIRNMAAERFGTPARA